MLCGSCGHENREGASFCVSCGTRISRVCSNCGGDLSPDARFCGSCGASVATATGPSLPDEEPSLRTPTSPSTTEEQRAETVEFLSKLAIFQHLQRQVLDSLAEQMQATSFPEGPICKEKEPVDGLYVIKSGTAKVTKSAEGGGPEAVLAILRDGDYFGEISVIDGLPASADVTAMLPMECYFLGRDMLMAALEQYPQLAIGMLRSLASMVRNADQWVARAI